MLLSVLLFTPCSAGFRVIVTDGVFSMDGHIAPLKAICDLADKYSAYVFIDECHSTGFFGKTGRGTPEYCGVEGRIDFINSTLGKALGGATEGQTLFVLERRRTQCRRSEYRVLRHAQQEVSYKAHVARSSWQ
jgi:7-keto-8-aminopelargonate synthetase-like enzyme